MTLLAPMQTQSRRTIILLGIFFIALVGAVDYATGSELSFSVFYLIPIALVTWYGDGRVGVFAAVASAIVWFLADLLGDRVYSNNAIPYWNALVRLSMFLIVSFTLTSLRAAQNRREELAQFVVHDLRSPLSNILAGLNLLNETMTDDMDKQIVTLGIASSNRMLTLINSMLDLAKLESGKMTLAVQETSVQDLFDAAIHQVSALADQEQVRVISRIDGDAGLIRADADVTVRVLVNLLSNALKYSPADSEVVVSAAPYTDNRIAVSVKDQGKGVPAQWANRVFDKFTQIEARKAGYAVGSGLGLSFCRLAVESQGGRIWLESEVNQGATVIFTLPRP